MDGRPVVGLRHAPITKFLIGGIIINSTIASVLDIRPFFNINIVSQLFEHHQYWRLSLWQLVYGSIGEVMFAGLALYKLAVVERFLGSRQFASLLAISFTTTSIAVPAILALMVNPLSGRANLLYSGLTPTIFAILYQYQALVPSSTSSESQQNRNQGTQISDVFTEKFWLYALALQMACSQLPGTLISSGTGWLIGALYYQNILPKNWRLPRFLDHLYTSKTTSTIIKEKISQPEIRTRTPAQRPSQAPPHTHAAVAAPPSDAEIEGLMSMMNVSREAAMQSIELAGGSVERAIDMMLGN